MAKKPFKYAKFYICFPYQSTFFVQKLLRWTIANNSRNYHSKFHGFCFLLVFWWSMDYFSWYSKPVYSSDKVDYSETSGVGMVYHLKFKHCLYWMNKWNSTLDLKPFHSWLYFSLFSCCKLFTLIWLEVPFLI